MFRLTHSLRTRESTGNNRSLQDWAAQENLLKDIHLNKKIPLERMHRSGFCNELAAVLEDENTLSLFDLTKAERLWTMPVSYLPNYELPVDALKVSDTGLTLLISNDQTNHFERDYQVHIFFDNRKIGAFMIAPCYRPHIVVVNDRIFIFDCTFGGTSFIERDKEGTLIQSKLIAGYASRITSDKNFLVMSFKKNARHNPVRYSAFVFNLHTNKQHFIDLLPNITKSLAIDIDDIKLSNNHLLIGYHYPVSIVGSPCSTPTNPSIASIDISNGNVIRNYKSPRELGHIKIFGVNNQFIVFLTNPHRPTCGALYCIDRKEHTVTGIKITEFVTGELTVSLMDHLAIVCMPTGYENFNNARIKRSIINLKTNVSLPETTLYRDAHSHAYFTNGLFIQTSYAKKGIFIEDFRCSAAEDGADEANTLRQHPSPQW